MLSTILRLYTAARAERVRTPVPHLFGPPGCGKSSFVEQAAKMLGVNLHQINVSRISPLELEGVQMPTEGKLELLLATYWNNLKDGDILFLDEFLRGFPEVYNGLLDILTSRTVGGHELPDVFIIAASNSTTAYDPALTDRLLHLYVPDPRTSKTEDMRIRSSIVSALGLLPSMATAMSMDALMSEHILPMYKMLDAAKGNNVGSTSSSQDMSPRNLIGQGQLRECTSGDLYALLESNNAAAMRQGKPQFVRIAYYKNRITPVDPTYVEKMVPLLSSDKLTPAQRIQAQVNINLIESDAVMKEASNDPFVN